MSKRQKTTNKTPIKIPDFQASYLENQILHNITIPLSESLAKVKNEQSNVFTALLFLDSPNWQHVIIALRDNFTIAMNSHLDTIKLSQNEMIRLLSDPLKTILLEKIEYDQKQAMELNSDMQSAMRDAITDSNFSPLRELGASVWTPVTLTLAKRLTEGTEHIARNSRLDRHTIHIGVKCLQLQAQGVKRLESQWRTVYKHIKANKDNLFGDELAAWEWFQSRDVDTLTPEKTRAFDNEISKIKTKAGKIYAIPLN